MDNDSLIKNPNFGKNYLLIVKFLISESIKINSNSKNVNINNFESKNQFLKLFNYVDENKILDFISRHRLFSFFEDDKLFFEYFPNLRSSIRNGSLNETISALSLASLSCEISNIFEKNNLPILTIKGIPLSIQTTGFLKKRGGGDLDIFVDTKNINNAIDILESIGFARIKSSLPKNLNSILGKYVLWADYQLSFYRNKNNLNQWIDLHWALSNVRGELPNFNSAWSRKEEIFINGNKIYTLSKFDAFYLSCCHASKDQWGSLRSLIDIHYLADKLTNYQLKMFSQSRVVNWSSKIVYDMTKSKKILLLSSSKVIFSKFIFEKAEKAQLSLVSVWDKKNGGSLRNYFWIILRNIFLSSNLVDLLRTLIFYIILPSDFLNQRTGEVSGLLGFFYNRFNSLIKVFTKQRDV